MLNHGPERGLSYSQTPMTKHSTQELKEALLHFGYGRTYGARQVIDYDTLSKVTGHTIPSLRTMLLGNSKVSPWAKVIIELFRKNQAQLKGK